MVHPIEKTRDVVHAVEHPVETARALEQEAERGASPRTPLIVISAVTVAVGIAFAILVTVALLLYFAYGGK
jgi:hypothetical protein